MKTEKGQALTPSVLTGIRAATHRHLTCAPLSRNISILQESEFISANKMFEGKAKLFTKQCETKTQIIYSVKRYAETESIPHGRAEQLEHGVWKNAEKLVEFVWFSLCFRFARRVREGWRALTRLSFETKTDYTGARNLRTIWPCVLTFVGHVVYLCPS